jgi:hypothetical protein
MNKIMPDDVDFVTVRATWFSGRADFEKYHMRLLSGRFKESTNVIQGRDSLSSLLLVELYMSILVMCVERPFGKIGTSPWLD